jgi:hypothetical protein
MKLRQTVETNQFGAVYVMLGLICIAAVLEMQQTIAKTRNYHCKFVESEEKLNNQPKVVKEKLGNFESLRDIWIDLSSCGNQ